VGEDQTGRAGARAILPTVKTRGVFCALRSQKEKLLMAYRRNGYPKKKRKGKGDSVWHARRTAGQCGLSEKDLHSGDLCLFLKVEGDQADPTRQIIGRVKAGSDEVEQVSADGRVFRSVPTGRHRCKRNACKAEYDYYQRFCNERIPDGKGGTKVCRAPTGAIFKWQEGRPTGDVDANGEPVYRWHDVLVWEKVVLADEAVARGFHVPTMSDGKFRMTEAHEGERTEGHAHSVSEVPESPLVDVARAAIPDEELGLPVEGTAPKTPTEAPLSQDDLDFLASLPD
jgi:hypothetical protein